MLIKRISEFSKFISVCYRLIEGRRGMYFLYILLSVLAALTEGVGVTMLVPILETSGGDSSFANVPIMGEIGSLFEGMGTTEKLQYIAVVLALVLVLRGVLLYFVGALGGIIPLKLQRNLFDRGYASLLTAEYSFFTEKTTGEHTNSLVEWVLRVAGVLSNVGSATYNIILFLVYLALMLVLSWKLALLGGLVAVLMSAALKQFTEKVLQRTGAELSEKDANISEMIFETISGMKFIKVSAAESVMLPRYKKALDEKIAASRTMVLFQSITGPFLSTFSGLLICVLLFVTPYIRDEGGQWIGGLLLFLFLMMRLMSPVSLISAARVQIASHIFALERLNEFFHETERRRQPSGDVPFKGIQHDIKFEKVSFQYDNSDERAVHDLTLEIPAGKMVAIVGPSGSGKSTLVSLLTRFYDPQSGRIAIDGQDLRDLDIYDLRRNINVVSQDTFIFNDTVRNNLSFPSEGVMEDDIRKAAKLAAADEFIDALPEGYDTKLGDRGVRLSGGQQQRIAIARAVLCNSDLLVFDEATSHLDTFTEQAIQDAVEELRKDRTVLVIAHRLSTIRRADSVAVLKNGKIVEQGNHKDLMAAQGEYWDMVQHQNLDLVDDDEAAPVVEPSH